MSARDASDSGSGFDLLLAQGRILEMLADCNVLEGTAEHLIGQLGVSASAFRLALLDLVASGWVYTNTTHEGVLTIGRERRVPDDGLGSHPGRRRPAALHE